MAGDGKRKQAVNRGSAIVKGGGGIPFTRGGDAKGSRKASAINKRNSGTEGDKRRDAKTIRTGSNIRRGRG